MSDRLKYLPTGDWLRIVENEGHEFASGEVFRHTAPRMGRYLRGVVNFLDEDIDYLREQTLPFLERASMEISNYIPQFGERDSQNYQTREALQHAAIVFKEMPDRMARQFPAAYLRQTILKPPRTDVELRRRLSEVTSVVQQMTEGYVELQDLSTPKLPLWRTYGFFETGSFMYEEVREQPAMYAELADQFVRFLLATNNPNEE